MSQKVKIVAKGGQNPPHSPVEEEYAKSHSISPLGLTITVVSDGLGAGIISAANEEEAAACFLLRGYGTSPKDYYDVLGFGEPKKHVILALMKLSHWPSFKTKLGKKFNVTSSRITKGISAIIPLDAIIGVSTYKFVSNQRGGNQPQEDVSMIQNSSKYATIFAIVNDGFTDIVMTAARQAGARGGTVIGARGTGNKEIEKFYGVAITPEKQIVMIMVDQEIKDDVLKSVNTAVGFATKGQGIVFAIPTSDVLGIAEDEPKES